MKDALAGLVDERVDEILNREENKVLLDGLEKASQRVELAKRELAEIEKQELEAKQMRDYITQLESKASEVSLTVSYFVMVFLFFILFCDGFAHSLIKKLKLR